MLRALRITRLPALALLLFCLNAVCLCQARTVRPRRTTTTSRPLSNTRTTTTVAAATTNLEEHRHHHHPRPQPGTWPTTEQPRLIEEFDQRDLDGHYEYRYRLSNGDTRYERSYWLPVGKNWILARKGYYSIPLPNSKFSTIFYTADHHGYHVDQNTLSATQPVLPRTLDVPDVAERAPPLTGTTTARTSTGHGQGQKKKQKQKPTATNTKRNSISVPEHNEEETADVGGVDGKVKVEDKDEDEDAVGQTTKTEKLSTSSWLLPMDEQQEHKQSAVDSTDNEDILAIELSNETATVTADDAVNEDDHDDDDDDIDEDDDALALVADN